MYDICISGAGQSEATAALTSSLAECWGVGAASGVKLVGIGAASGMWQALAEALQLVPAHAMPKHSCIPASQDRLESGLREISSQLAKGYTLVRIMADGCW